MQENILDDLLQKELIAPDDALKIRHFESARPFSLHWELTILLYLGVLLLNAGLGFLIYENIDSIGHVVLITAIGLVSAGCFAYAIWRRQPFSFGEVKSSTPYYDYILLLGCLTFLLMVGYWQFQYQIFGTRYGLATLIPMLLFFFVAYRFDNRAVLSLAITAMASWLGMTVTSNKLLSDNDFSSQAVVTTGLFLGAFLSAVPFISEHFGFKKHFSLTYLNFGAHLLMISCLAGMMALDESLIYFPLLCLSVGFYLWYARTRHSFYFLTVAVIYGYIGITYLLIKAADNFPAEFYLTYFVLSCIGVILFLTQYKRFFKNKTA